jgi:hypothetical protein
MGARAEKRPPPPTWSLPTADLGSSRGHHKATRHSCMYRGRLCGLREFESRGDTDIELKTESGDQVLLPLSERTTRQLQQVISEFNRTRDLLFVEERPSASARLQ